MINNSVKWDKNINIKMENGYEKSDISDYGSWDRKQIW